MRVKIMRFPQLRNFNFNPSAFLTFSNSFQFYNGFAFFVDKDFKLVRMVVPLKDTESENLLDYLEVCIDFIDRSRKEFWFTVLVVFLEDALESLKVSCEFVCPNDGFLEQISVMYIVDVRILLTSTSEAYWDPLENPQPKTYWGNVNPIGVCSCYDEGKRVAETLLFDYHRQHGIGDSRSSIPLNFISFFVRCSL
ncbi:hypothetical protein RYX36_031128 [Vicia faba]